MAWQRKIRGSFLAFAGYMLSPLSWWNDAVVNLPLALVFAWGVAAIYKPGFQAAVVVGYWLTNVVGLILLHKGAQTLLSEKERKYSLRDLGKDVVVSLAYTVLILLLLKFGVLQPLQNYFPAHSGQELAP